jgi:transcriptional regulator with PAS, ATPase and Fis domain
MQRAEQLIGSSAATRAQDGDLTVAAGCDAKVLITGESGVGKEIAARLIHSRSPRARMPLVTINCAGLPDSLLETELFGHVKGSFTGAYRDKPGLLQLAHGGAIFLDEVGEMSLRMQAVLLRFLETGEVQQVGTDRLSGHIVDVRVICATHRDLRARIIDGQFREDLFYRLNVLHIHIPPLRERRDDVRDIFAHFFSIFAERQRRPEPSLTPAARELLFAYDWPGNVRELKNVAERLVVRETPFIDVADLPVEVRVASLATEGSPHPSGEDETPVGVARRILLRMLKNGESFWEAVYEPFLAHDLTRQHMRLIISFGLEQTQGRCSDLVRLFNMAKPDSKRFLTALRKHDCLVPFPSRNEPAAAATSSSRDSVDVR